MKVREDVTVCCSTTDLDNKWLHPLLDQHFLLMMTYVEITKNLLIGDFNSQNILMGDRSTFPIGTIWEILLTTEAFLPILNDGSPTLLSTKKNPLTAVDVAMASTDIAPTLTWRCLPLPEVCDHFQILIYNRIATNNK